MKNEVRGFVTTVQRMSIHDGPGIRSTLFFKGCNLRCKWCHNPETWNMRRQLQYVADKCIRCSGCVSVCDFGAIGSSVNGISIRRDRCTSCGRCVGACVSNALTWVGREITAAEAVRELLQDRIYFDISGGGVTLSGGEPLLQSRFACEILRDCLAEGVHTAVESNLTADWEVIEEFLPLVKLWMCDLKIADSEQHGQWTGSGNERIIVNMRQLAARKVPLIVRTPIVPGVNDSEAQIDALCRIVAGLDGHVAYELLGFHPLGFGKFDDLGLENPLAGTDALDEELLARLRTIPAKYGIKDKL